VEKGGAVNQPTKRDEGTDHLGGSALEKGWGVFSKSLCQTRKVEESRPTSSSDRDQEFLVNRKGQRGNEQREIARQYENHGRT